MQKAAEAPELTGAPEGSDFRQTALAVGAHLFNGIAGRDGTGERAEAQCAVEVEIPQLSGQHGMERASREAADVRAVALPPEHVRTRGCEDETPGRLLLQNPIQERKQPRGMLDLINDDALACGSIREQFAKAPGLVCEVAAKCRGLHIQMDGIRQLVGNPGRFACAAGALEHKALSRHIEESTNKLHLWLRRADWMHTIKKSVKVCQ
ncbi:MAG: hypothetical protein OXI71_17715 [Gemmatimonadota bacterium]|nr:hypothetical protein [Gemmatimonadota bacterium]